MGICGQPVVERDQVAQAVAGLQLVELQQLVGDGDAVDALAALVQVAHALEDAAVLLQAEVVGLEGAGGLDVETVVEQDRAEHESLGIHVGGKTFFGHVGSRHGVNDLE